MQRARLAVVYDTGAASPLEISRVSRVFAPMAVVLGESEDAAAMAPLFGDLGRVTPAGASFAEQIALLTRWRPDGIVTFSERMLRRTAALARDLGLPFHTPEVAERLTDKHLQRAALADGGVSPVRSRLLTTAGEWADAIAYTGLPAVLKPCSGEGSRNTFLIDDAAEGGRRVRELLAGAETRLVVEEYLAGRPEPRYGDYVSVECAAVGGKIHPIAVTGKYRLTPPFREAGNFWPSHLNASENDEVTELAVAAVRALGITGGLSHTEIKLTPAGPRIIEVNGRLGGSIGELALRATGIDLVELACRIALGEMPEVKPATPDRVHFQHLTLTPEYPCTVAAIRGGQAASRVPGIRQFRPYVRPGQRLPGGVHTGELDLLAGDAPDHDAMFRALSDALHQVTYALDTADGRREVSAAQLTAACDHPSPARSRTVPGTLIHESVAARAAEQPDAVAMIHRGMHTDYRTLNAAADAYAAELARHGVGPGTVIPVSLPRSPHLAMTLLAILKCGAAYAALDRRWPSERVDTMLRLLDSPLTITEQDGPTARGLDEWAATGHRPPGVELTPDAPACVFFTSGTTGVPKAVLSPHRATTRLFGPTGPLAFGPGRIMCQVSPPAWDAFSLELWGMLTTGATVVVSEDDHLLPHVLQRMIADHGANTVWLTASLFNLFTDLEPECFTGLEQIFTGGERLSPAHILRFLDHHPEIALINGYGPVESCVFATCHPITRADLDRPDGIPLGRPLPETGIHLLNGEICVSGSGLALEYLGQPELTAERFIETVVDGAPLQVYRTGDLGRLDTDGVLHFGGRADRQVKIRGYRIEPVEIEAAASRIAGVGQCVVVPVPTADGPANSYEKLALFYTSAQPVTIADPLGVRRGLTTVLPHYAVPDTVRQVPAIPVSPNGKTDTKALLAGLTHRSSRPEYAPQGAGRVVAGN